MARFLNPRQWPAVVWLLIITGTAGAAAVHWALTSPQVVLLLPARGARWIARDEPFNLDAPAPMTFSAFSTNFVLPAAKSSADLRVTALRRVVVIVDGKSLFDNGADVPDWRHEYHVPIPAGSLVPGTHQLKLFVANRFGLPLVRADCAELGIHTDESWQASADQKSWKSAVLADRPWMPAMTGDFPTAAEGTKRCWPLLVVLLIAGSGLHLFLTRRFQDRPIAWGRWIKWSVLAAWFLLAWNNLFQVPPHVGYDAPSHLEYIRYVAGHWRAPLPNEMWESFHPPLYYFCSAGLYKLALAGGASVDRATLLLRLIPLLCGLLMVELCHRAGRLAFRGSQASHAVAAVVGGLLPMNLYMAQAVSNEPMAACFGGFVTLICVRMLIDSSEGKSIPTSRQILQATLLGSVVGITVLTKLSGLIWLGPCSVVLFCSSRRWRDAIASIATFLAATSLVCGWYFLRNDRAIGVPFLSHSTIINTRWWQEPGFRAPMHFLRFGSALTHPVFGDLTSFWDNLYSTLFSDGMLNGVQPPGENPPWNFNLMACGVWLALPILAVIAIGAGRVFKRNDIPGHGQSAVGFAIGSIAVFLAGLIYVCLTWPIYSDVKASYLLALTPCLAILFAAGFARFASHPWLRALSSGVLTCWAVVAYLTYFVW